MSNDFVEKMTLDFDGSAVDGTAAKGLGKTFDAVGFLMKELRGLADFQGGEVALLKMAAGATVLTSAFLATGAAVGSALGRVMAETAKAADEAEHLTIKLATVYAGTTDWASATMRAAAALPGLVSTSAVTGTALDTLGGAFRRLSILTGAADADVQRLTKNLAVASASAGVDIEQLVSGIARGVTTGSLEGFELGKALGLTGKDLQTAYQTGTLLEYLTSHLKVTREQAEQLSMTWDVLAKGITTNARDIEATLGTTWDPLKIVFAELRETLGSDWLKRFAVDLADVGKGLVADQLVKWYSHWVAFKELLSPIADKLRLVLALQEAITGEEQGWQASVGHFGQKPGEGEDDVFAKANASYRKLVDDLSRKSDLAGLDGLKKQLAEIADENDRDVVRLHQAWEKTNLGAEAFLADLAEVTETTARKTRAALEAEAASQKQAIDKYNQWSALFKEKLDLSGLEGLGLALAKTNLQYDKGAGDIRRHTAAIEAFSPAAKAAEEGLLALNEAGRQLSLGVDIEDAARKFKTGMEQIEAMAEDSDLARIDSAARRQQAELDSLDSRLLREVRTQADLVALDEKTAVARRAIENKRALDSALILDKQAGRWDAYYEDLVKAARLAGAGVVEATQASLRQVADAMYRNASTIADGVSAAMLKIRSELKTEGQIWADYLGGIWGGIADGFNDFLYTVETGTGSLTDVLKGMYDSLLRSFNKMVTEMVQRWLFGEKQMQEGGSGGGFLSDLGSLFGGQKAKIDAQGKVKLPTGWSSSQVEGGAPQGGPSTGINVGNVIGAGAAGAGLGSVVGGMSGAPGFSTGAVIGGTVAAAGIALAAAGAFGAVAAGAAAGSVVPIIGTIIGAIIGGLIAVLSSPNTESKVWGMNLIPQLRQAGNQIQASVMDVYAKSLLPDGSAFAKKVQLAIGSYLTKAIQFQIHAGSSEDIQADIKQLLTGIVPSELLHVLIGQQRVGGQDVAGISGASKYGGALDPKAPINQMLTDLGFTAKKIEQLAGDIDVLSPEEWMKQLSGLVGIVAGVNKLSKEVSKTYAETVADAAAESAKSPAGKMAERLAGVKDLLEAVSFYVGTEQVAKGQEALQAAQQFYDQAKAAMLQLAAMAKQISQEYLDSVKKIEDALKTPAELFAQSFGDLQADYERMRFASNPEDLSAAWAKARADFEAVASVLVQRIQQIRSVLADIHTLQEAMAAGPGPNAQTDPQAWLAKNMESMEKFRVAMLAASPGSPEQVAAATSYAASIRDRYQMELDLLARVKSTILSINQSIDEQLFQLDLGEKTGNDKAQFLYARINDLYGQLQGANTPEEVQRLTSQIQSLTGTLLQQVGPNDPHRGEAVAFVRNILELVRGAATTNLGAQGAAAEFDISTLGKRLGEAETVMQTALTAVTGELTDLEWHFKRAMEFATGKLNEWGVEIQTQLEALDPVLKTMVRNFTEVNAAIGGGRGTGGGGAGGGGGAEPGTDLPRRLDNFSSGLGDASAAILDFTAALKGGKGGGGGVNVTVSVNSLAPSAEEIADQVWDELVPALQQAQEENNVRVVRHMRETS